mgnify:CR=1 FL=1
MVCFINSINMVGLDKVSLNDRNGKVWNEMPTCECFIQYPCNLSTDGIDISDLSSWLIIVSCKV